MYSSSINHTSRLLDLSSTAHQAVSLHMDQTTIEPYCLHLWENDEGFMTVG